MKTKSFSCRLALTIRKIMIPPVMSVLFFAVLYRLPIGIFTRTADFAAAVLCIGLFPVLAYPVSVLVPGIRKKGREGQRNLAFVFSVAGYLLGFLYSFIPGRSAQFRLITLIYVFSVAALLVFNKLLKIRASGHSCAVTGPMLACLLLIGPKSLLPCLLLWGLSLWSSVISGRHTLREFLTGALANLIAGVASVLALTVL